MHDCDGSLHPNAIKGILLFNEGRYFEAHEELELAWREENGSIRGLYQGILEAGVAYLHIQRRNLAGALKVYGRCLRWLDRLPDICRGIAVGQLRHDLDVIMAEANRLGPDHLGEMALRFFRPIAWEAH